jgi:hypothetical protein
METIDEGVKIVDGPEAEERAREDANAAVKKKMSFSRRSKFRMLSPEVKKEKFKAGLDEDMMKINAEYKEKFLEALEKFGAKNIRDLADDKKQEFFNYIDQHNEEVEQIDEISLQTMKSAKDKLSRKAYDAHMDDNKNDARFQATRALKMGDKIKDKVARTVTHGGKTYTLPKDSSLIRKEELEQMGEEHSPEHIKQAIGIAADKRYRGGNMTGAVDAIEKIKAGLSGHPQVKAVLKSKNESLDHSQEEIVNEGKFSEMDIDNQEAKRRASGKTDAPTDFAKIGASIKKDRENAAKKMKTGKMKEDFIFQIKKSVMLGEQVSFEDGETRTLTRVEAHKFLNKYITSGLAEQLELTENATKSYNSFLHLINKKQSGE